MEKILVLSIVVEAQHSFDFPATNAKPGSNPVVGNRPVERWMPLAELSQIAVVYLRAHAEIIGDAGGHVQPHIGHSAAARVGVHGEPVVAVGVGKALGQPSMHLHIMLKELELLGSQQASSR